MDTTTCKHCGEAIHSDPWNRWVLVGYTGPGNVFACAARWVSTDTSTFPHEPEPVKTGAEKAEARVAELERELAELRGRLAEVSDWRDNETRRLTSLQAKVTGAVASLRSLGRGFDALAEDENLHGLEPKAERYRGQAEAYTSAASLVHDRTR